jgi:hypothetical protein
MPAQPGALGTGHSAAKTPVVKVAQSKALEKANAQIRIELKIPLSSLWQSFAKLSPPRKWLQREPCPAAFQFVGHRLCIAMPILYICRITADGRSVPFGQHASTVSPPRQEFSHHSKPRELEFVRASFILARRVAMATPSSHSWGAADAAPHAASEALPGRPCSGISRNAYWTVGIVYQSPVWRRGRAAEGGGLLNRYRVVKSYRGFESLRLRHIIW